MVTAAGGRTSAARLIHEQRQEEPDVVRLAQSLSLAAQAEPYVVRAARLRFVPRSSAGLEAQLWFSPLVEAAGGLTMVLDPAVAAVLRRDLATNDRALLASVRSFTERAHHDAPLAVRTFETLLWAGTAQAVPAEGDIRRELEPFLAQVLSDGPEALEAGRWAIRHLPRLPDAVRDSAPARRLRIAAAERLGLELTPAAAGLLPEEVTAVRRMVHRDVDVGIRAEPGGIVLTRPPERDAQVCQVSGAARVRLRLRAALPGAAWHELDLHDRRRAAAPWTWWPRPGSTAAWTAPGPNWGTWCAASGPGSTERSRSARRAVPRSGSTRPDGCWSRTSRCPRPARGRRRGAAEGGRGRGLRAPGGRSGPRRLGRGDRPSVVPGADGTGLGGAGRAGQRSGRPVRGGGPEGAPAGRRRSAARGADPRSPRRRHPPVDLGLGGPDRGRGRRGRVVARHAAPGNGMVSRRFATGGPR